MALQPKTTQNTFQPHTVYQVGRINRYLLKADVIYLNLATEKRKCLHMYIEAFKWKQCIGSLDDFNSPYQQI